MPSYSVRQGRYYFKLLVRRYSSGSSTRRYWSSTFLKNWKVYKRDLGSGLISAPASDDDVLSWLDRLDQVRLTGTSTTTSTTTTSTTTTTTT